MIKRNIRIRSFPQCHDVDPFVVVPDSPDLSIRQVSPEQTGNGLSLNHCEELSRVLPSGLTRIARVSAARNYVHSDNVVNAAERYESSLKSFNL